MSDEHAAPWLRFAELLEKEAQKKMELSAQLRFPDFITSCALALLSVALIARQVAAGEKGRAP